MSPQQQSNVFPYEAFRTLRMIQEDIAWYRAQKDDEKYLPGIEKEQGIYKELISRHA